MVGKDIDYETVPGNSHLIDLDGHIPGRLAKGKSNNILLPTPSDDYDDPLNWSSRRKWLAVFCNVVYTFGVGIPSAAIYSVLTNINITLGQLNAGTGYMFLFFGIGCIILQPIALQYGKRPVYLFSVFSTCLICVWAPYSKSNGGWIGNKILQGFVGSPIESLCEITLSDIFFEHERAKGMGIYAVALFTANYMAPMLAGFVYDGMGWKWVLWMSSVFSAVCFVFLFFFVEETNYDRNSKVKSLTTIEGIETEENNSNTTESKEKYRPFGSGSLQSIDKLDRCCFKS
ncbi:putative transporter [Wickerhamomyces ciferrii]|uniref:Transporter n=1 Tax=Wickerhamomyces ciferrii (strain ATCC 14091 / BCRC 22168 / CBS 111 / JCM 3599 / NBRC 0793 / NRRL Y-1031 F-60-10) TaxID=1206466 RepID=K0KVG2_WICCF|nr:putative transporter [Wickerhamomyces ciferrii]CCH45907.1 putative transporter [Wickerhamomyces ciferrii]